MRIIAIALIVVMLTGCSWTRDILVKTEPVDRIPLVLPEADEYSHRNVDWIIITPENAQEIFADLANTGRPIAIIGLTGDQYELLSLNVADQMLLIKQLNAIINAYEEYYIAVEKRDSEIKVVK
jgi:hypothetical protein